VSVIPVIQEVMGRSSWQKYETHIRKISKTKNKGGWRLEA
jgi:hypothetical protein